MLPPEMVCVCVPVVHDKLGATTALNATPLFLSGGLSSITSLTAISAGLWVGGRPDICTTIVASTVLPLLSTALQTTVIASFLTPAVFKVASLPVTIKVPSDD